MKFSFRSTAHGRVTRQYVFGAAYDSLPRTSRVLEPLERFHTRSCVAKIATFSNKDRWKHPCRTPLRCGGRSCSFLFIKNSNIKRRLYAFDSLSKARVPLALIGTQKRRMISRRKFNVNKYNLSNHRACRQSLASRDQSVQPVQRSVCCETSNRKFD